ncbi:ATP-binding protein [Actinomadura kijaniata]|uniref:Anti-sigma regulatory factor (Ser/Thr protein kinase) n=1 Tax=Actinomadura namibiensis TaxID=182080 RepID=A0A7W3QKQ8_ACTNM|nr:MULTISPECIES: ATP-binding protein [Actinomadura]MBA8950651.1 anti-sigma regulatory factor (Ser/Thr protein kinase) [Actinomadura namibiensis]
MATVELSFSALPVHVRTARLIVTAVARRSGIDEDLLDEVRLAVGEACSRAVEAHRLHCPDEPVRMEMTAAERRFEVIVNDSVPGDDSSGTGRPTTPADLPKVTGPDDLEFALGDGAADLGLAVIAGLADDVDISTTPKGVQIRMSWPVEAAPTT